MRHVGEALVLGPPPPHPTTDTQSHARASVRACTYTHREGDRNRDSERDNVHSGFCGLSPASLSLPPPLSQMDARDIRIRRTSVCLCLRLCFCESQCLCLCLDSPFCGARLYLQYHVTSSNPHKSKDLFLGSFFGTHRQAVE